MGRHVTIHLSDEDFTKFEKLAKERGLTPCNFAKKIILKVIKGELQV